MEPCQQTQAAIHPGVVLLTTRTGTKRMTRMKSHKCHPYKKIEVITTIAAEMTKRNQKKKEQMMKQTMMTILKAMIELLYYLVHDLGKKLDWFHYKYSMSKKKLVAMEIIRHRRSSAAARQPDRIGWTQGNREMNNQYLRYEVSSASLSSTIINSSNSSHDGFKFSQCAKRLLSGRLISRMRDYRWDMSTTLINLCAIKTGINLSRERNDSNEEKYADERGRWGKYHIINYNRPIK